MSEAARIILVGPHAPEDLLAELAKIKAWDNGHDYDIKVSMGDDGFVWDKIANVEHAIKTDLQCYINKKFMIASMATPFGPYVPSLDMQKAKEEAYDNASRIERGGSSRKPHRKHATNYTPPRKRRK